MRNKHLWALVVLAGLPLAARAQSALPKIEQPVRAGLPSGLGAGAGRTREGSWMPVYVKINAGPRGCKAGEYRLVVEATDAEETSYRNTLPFPTLAANEDFFAITYLRETSSEFQVWLEFADGQAVPKSRLTERAGNEPLRGSEPLFLVIGGFPSAGLKKALTPPKTQPNAGQPFPNGPGGFKGGPPQPMQPGIKDRPQPPLDKMPINDKGEPDKGDAADNPEEVIIQDSAANSYAYIGSIQDLPENWYGYDAVDVVVLMTDDAEFLKKLANAPTRRKALVEWVRRGGRLVISVGSKADLVADLLQNMPLPEGDKGQLLDCDIEFNVRRKILPSLNTWAQLSPESRLRDVTVAKLVPGRGTRVLLSEPAEVAPVQPATVAAACGPLAGMVAPLRYDGEPRPLIVDSACGLGRVLLVAFDLDARPFTGWPGQVGFWKRLREETAPGLKVANEGGQNVNMNWMGDRSEQELLRLARNSVETFGDVHPVHFGWVALFIVVYIAIVGPLDYLLLSKVFKRLELTWVTFPAVVLTLSIGAYFGAYALKGDKRRFNKMDVVEIDLANQQAYGTSWFAIFSPRIENYTISVEPIFPGKALTPQNTRDGHAPVVTVLEAPQGFNAMRTGSSSLFNRSYEYAPAATGLERVPIPVWSIRSFTASWRTPLSDEPPILVTGASDKDLNTLVVGDRQGTLHGHIKNNLPVALKDVSLFYQGKWYQPPGQTGQQGYTLAPGASFPVADWGLSPADKAGGQPANRWLADNSAMFPKNAGKGLIVVNRDRGGFQGVQGIGMAPHTIVKDAMFFERDQGGVQGFDNSGMRRLDQSWRFHEVKEIGGANAAQYLDEVILVARTDYVENVDAQTVNEKSLVRLWVGDLPKANAKAPPLTGQTTENTFVRVYIPVRPRR
jgi:hypothetical protein